MASRARAPDRILSGRNPGRQRAKDPRPSPPDEFALIDRLAALLPSIAERPDVIVGIGDDAAVLDVGGPELLVATTDAQVAGTHFRGDWLSPEDVGWRALAVNVSDVAAMGGRAHTALVSLVLPVAVDVAWLEGVYRGLAEAGRTWGVAIVGGNVSRAAESGSSPDDSLAGLVIDVTVLGAVVRDQVLTRSGARSGDRVLVVGAVGGAAAGRHLLAGDAATATLDDATRSALYARWRRPQARVAAAQAIAATGLATSMIDVSDGFAADLGHICDASGIGVHINPSGLPLAPGVRAVAEAMEASGAKDMSADLDPALGLALGGGEDYALVLTVAPQYVATLHDAVAQGGLFDVGEIVDPSAGRRLVDADGQSRPLPADGWRHVG